MEGTKQVQRLSQKMLNAKTSEEQELIYSYVQNLSKEDMMDFMLNVEAGIRPDFSKLDKVICNTNLLNMDVLNLMCKDYEIYSNELDTFFLNKALVEFMKDGQLHSQIYFEIVDRPDGKEIRMVEDSKIHNNISTMSLLIKDGVMLPAGSITRNLYSKIKGNLGVGRIEVGRSYCLSTFLTLCRVNAIITHKKDSVTETTKRIPLSSKKKSKNIKYKNVRTIYINSIKTVPEVAADGDIREYNRHTEEWTRRGYWMTTRKGEKKWIAPTTCRAKIKSGERKSKIYVVK